jgi:DNA-binding response OmpR family regulator
MALESLSISVDTADTGAGALDKLAGGSYDLLLLDLRLPDLDGMEILRRISQTRPEIKVIIITAYGSIDLAVEAMKLGAVDFLQKPFELTQVREMVRRILAKQEEAIEYADYIALARKRISEGYFDIAGVSAQKAVFLNPKRPEALNLLGGIAEAKGNRQEAAKYYRAALSLDPTYLPAQLNLERVGAQPYVPQAILWGD